MFNSLHQKRDVEADMSMILKAKIILEAILTFAAWFLGDFAEKIFAR